MAFVKETLKVLGGKEVSWGMAGGEYRSNSLFHITTTRFEIDIPRDLSLYAIPYD